MGRHVFGVLFHLVCIAHVDLLEQRVASHANFLRELLVGLATLESLVCEFEEVLNQNVIFDLVEGSSLDLDHFVASHFGKELLSLSLVNHPDNIHQPIHEHE